MRVWGLASTRGNEVVEFFGSREEAQQALAQVLRDEPDWRNIVFLVAVELPDSTPPPRLSLN
jgi:hypothetical protein